MHLAARRSPLPPETREGSATISDKLSSHVFDLTGVFDRATTVETASVVTAAQLPSDLVAHLPDGAQRQVLLELHRHDPDAIRHEGLLDLRAVGQDGG